MIRALVAVLIALAAAFPASAQEPGTIDGVEQVFVRWMKQHGVARKHRGARDECRVRRIVVRLRVLRRALSG